MPSFVDSHCHLPLLGDVEGGAAVDDALAAAALNGVDHMLCVSVDLATFPIVLELARAHPHIFASVGVHPNAAVDIEPQIGELVRLATDSRIVAIGETGLDYYRSTGQLDWQRERFRIHVRAARACGKPLIIHSRDAREDVIAILREEGAEAVGGVMHCFVDDWDTARAAMEMNFYISFSGIVTFRNAGAVQAVARRIPLDRLLIETDAPYLAPAPHRGRANQPAYVRHVAEGIALLRGVPVEDIAAATTANFFRLFRDARPARA
jgi:TatD DNase family protein